MTNVLTRIEISSTGELTNTVPALLAAAAQLRTPVGGTDPISELGSLGPEQIYVAEREQVGALLATPQQLADALDAAVGAPGRQWTQGMFRSPRRSANRRQCLTTAVRHAGYFRCDAAPVRNADGENDHRH